MTLTASTAPTLSPLAVYDIVSTAILLLLSLTVAFKSTNSNDKLVDDGGLDEVRPILVENIRPRRALVLALVWLVALTYAADATVNILRAILLGTWSPPGPVGLTSYLLGFLAFALLSIFLSWKDTKGQGVWNAKRVRVFVILAVFFQVAHLIWAITGGHLREPRNPPIGIPEKPLPPAGLYSPLLHYAIASLRLLILLPLYPSLTHPYRSYTPSSSLPTAQQTAAAENGASSSITRPLNTAFEPSSGLLAPKPTYGTFTPINGGSAQPSQGTSRVTTPGPENGVATSKGNKQSGGGGGNGSSTGAAAAAANGGAGGSSGTGGTAAAEITPEPTWSELGRRIRKLLPYLWPRGSVRLEGLALFCLLLLIVARFMTFYTPATLRELVAMFDRVGREPGPTPRQNPWKLLFLYVGLRFLQGSGGLNALRDIAWAPVMQFSDRRMSQMAFEHLLNLSMAFHTRRKTGEVLRILDRGQVINHIFELILFNVFPAIIDIVVALIVFVVWFNWVLSAVVFFVMLTYFTLSVMLTTWRTKIRRQMNERDIVTRGIHTDCLINYETVKYFGGEQHEAERYRQAIADYQTVEYKVLASLNLLNLVQNFIISFGLLIGSILIATEVVNGTKNTSDFIFFITYLAQVYGPLNQLGYIYRSINQSLVDTEKLFKLLDEPKDVNDKPDAKELVVTDGVIEFRNVSFTYDDKTTALRGVSFTVPKGHSVALVGESGSGKSTILRLLYRFYDLSPEQGSILIDGQDIRDVTQASLRHAIGVVPQDSVLFNNTITYNIGYGKFGATQNEVEIAAQAAQMHERISSFPNGYETKVGERGVRLSGGEKQRVSIARTFLKNAPILLLDEATSALDTTTEKDIQKALQNLVTGRSSISIAHRLSTIANSDIILVLKDGEIIESGSHQALIAANGSFATMWAEQITTDAEQRSIEIPSEEPKTAPVGYNITPSTKATTLPETQIVPNPPVQDPSLGLAPGPVIPRASLEDVKVASHAELAARAAELNAAPGEITPSIEVPPSLAPESAVHTEAPGASQAPSYAEVTRTSDGASEAEPASQQADTQITPTTTDAPSFAAVAAQTPAENAPVVFPTSVAEPEVDTKEGVEAKPEPATEPESKPSPEAAPAPIAFPTSDETASVEAPVAFPTEEAPAAPVAFPETPSEPQIAPVAFPAEDQDAQEAEPSGTKTPVVAETGSITSAPATPGIKFAPGAGGGSSSRPGTPDPNAAEKRKRTTSQNLQRLARRISLGGRRGSDQAAEAVRAVKAAAASGSRSDSPTPSPTPKDNFMAKLKGRSSSFRGESKDKDDKSSLRDSIAGTSLKGGEETGSNRASAFIDADDDATSQDVPANDNGSGSKSKKNKKKGKK